MASEPTAAHRLDRAETVDKSPDAFRTISEVAADLDLPQHVLRFWETRFVQIRPLKRGGGRRYYRPDDVELLKGIRHLLYGEGYTIRGVQRILKEQGVRFVMTVWHEGAPQPQPAGGEWERGSGPEDEPVFEDEAADDAALPPDEAYSPYVPHRGTGEAAGGFGPVDGAEASERREPHFEGPDSDDFAAMAQRFAPTLSEPPVAGPEGGPPRAVPRVEPDLRPPEAVDAPRRAVADDAAAVPGLRPSRLPAGLRPPEAPAAPRAGLGQFLDRLRPNAGREPTEAVASARGGQALSRDEIRRLQSTLFELLECKRLLDQVR